MITANSIGVLLEELARKTGKQGSVIDSQAKKEELDQIYEELESINKRLSGILSRSGGGMVIDQGLEREIVKKAI